MYKKEISIEEYHSYIIELAKQIKNDNNFKKFNHIVALARGGVPVGDALSRLLKLPLAILFTSSYCDKTQTNLHIGATMANQKNTLGNHILLVDDLVDSGQTLKETCHFLYQNNQINQIKTAVIWKKQNSLFTPDFFVNSVNEEWIEQPFEIFDNITL